MIADMLKNIWKEYFIKECFTCAILSFSSPRCAIIACRNVIYRKSRRAMIAPLNKIWRVWACAHPIAGHSRPDLYWEHCHSQNSLFRHFQAYSGIFTNIKGHSPTFINVQGHLGTLRYMEAYSGIIEAYWAIFSHIHNSE